LDAINFSLALDNFVAKEYDNLAPHKSVFSLDKPFEVSGNLAMPKPVVTTVNNFMHTPMSDEDFDIHKDKMFEHLLIN
jgi:hypothetical protein